MLMDIKCSAVTSVKVLLTFDDNSHKEAVISVGDLIDVVYNANGLRKHACGKVLVVSATGNDPKGWYIIVDGSDDFGANKARFSPMSILSLEIITKGDSIENIRTVRGEHAVPFLRLVKGSLQWSKDGFKWNPVGVYDRDIIEDQEGTFPAGPDDRPEKPDDRPFEPEEDDGIEDAVW